jgi:hypothetical protein
MERSLGARFPRRVGVLRRGENERAAILRIAVEHSVRDVAPVRLDAPRARADAQPAGARAAVAIVENHRQVRPAVENAIEVRAQFLVPNVERAQARVGRDNRLIQLVGLGGKRIPDLRAVSGEVNADHVALRGDADEILQRLNHGGARRGLVGQCNDVAPVDTIQKGQHLLQRVHVIDGAIEVEPVARRSAGCRFAQARRGVIVDADEQGAVGGEKIARP